MAQGNKGFAAGLAETITPATSGARLPPRTGILASRENRLAELATGASTTRIQELIDPARCRIWDGHNRDYVALNEENCADLIESFKAQGRQEVPAIVRRIVGDSVYIYEVICGARRHWSVSWMRDHNYPDFRFLVEPRELTDEEAFRIADLENRSRRDLSDYERASDYARALDRYYGASQQKMAERLEVSKSWLSRYLDLAKLPAEVLASFGSPHVIGISHGAALAPLLKNPLQGNVIIDEASRLAEEQRARVARGETFLPPAAVLQRLVGSGHQRVKSGRAVVKSEHVVRNADGGVLARGTRTARGGGFTITVPSPARYGRDETLAAITEIMIRLTPNVVKRGGP